MKSERPVQAPPDGLDPLSGNTSGSYVETTILTGDKSNDRIESKERPSHRFTTQPYAGPPLYEIDPRE